MGYQTNLLVLLYKLMKFFDIEAVHWQRTSCSQTATISKNFISLYSNTNKFVWYGNFIIRFLGRPWTVHWLRISCSQTATISKNFISLYSNTNKFVCYGNLIISPC